MGRNYSDQDVINNAKECKSVAELLRSLGLRDVGGNYYTIRRKIQQLKIDTSHFTGQLWSKGEQLKDWTQYTRSGTLKPHLLKQRGHVCECCNLSEWMDNPITLELHHVDGNRTNNDPSNLQLLCPNCHSFTDNWRNKKK